MVDPHLSELNDCGQIVIVGKDTFSIEWVNVSTTVMIGTSDHATME